MSDATAAPVPAARRFPWGVPNPFYLLSATAFIHGTTWPGGAAGDSSLTVGMQLGLAAAYTAVSAATAVWLVRRLGRWDDARSLVVIVAGMFAVASLELDAWLPTAGRPLRLAACAALFAATVATLEAVRRGAGVRLPGRFLAALYAQWGLLLLAPAAMSERPDVARLQVAAFALASAGAWLLYLPSVGRARPLSAVGWRYPWCPWTLAVVTGAATLARLAMLAVSFDAVPEVVYARSWNWTTVLSGEFLVPYAAALSLLLAASGGRSGRAWVQRLAAATAAAAVGLVALPKGPVAAEFRAGLEWLPVGPALAGLCLASLAAMRWKGLAGSRWGLAGGLLAAKYRK